LAKSAHILQRNNPTAAISANRLKNSTAIRTEDGAISLRATAHHKVTVQDLSRECTMVLQAPDTVLHREGITHHKIDVMAEARALASAQESWVLWLVVSTYPDRERRPASALHIRRFPLTMFFTGCCLDILF
jgi:hypothetical protein